MPVRKVIKKSLINVFSSHDRIENCLTYTKTQYRPHDPGGYLYNRIIDFHDSNQFNKKFTDDFFELLYVTLKAWNMNQRGAKLQIFEEFKNSLIKNRKMIESLQLYKIEKLSNHELNHIRETLEKLFNNLNLVAYGKPKLITFSKTLHFLLPKLCMPIDRRYSLKFYNTGIPKDKNDGSIFGLYFSIYSDFRLLAMEKTDMLLKFEDNTWNRTIPKTIDNLIIGYVSLSNKNKITQKRGAKIKEIIDLHRKGYMNRDIVAMGYNKSTVAIQVAKYKKLNDE